MTILSNYKLILANLKKKQNEKKSLFTFWLFFQIDIKAFKAD